MRLRIAHPDVNRSQLLCTAEGDDTLRLGLTFVKGIDSRLGSIMLKAREARPFAGLSDVLARSGLSREALENLTRAGAMDSLSDFSDRSTALWQVGTGYVSGVRRGQLALPMAVSDAPGTLAARDRADRMLDEYAMMGLCPDGHVMELVRHELRDVFTSDELLGTKDGDTVRVAGTGRAPAKAAGGGGVPDSGGRVWSDSPGGMAGGMGAAQGRAASYPGGY